MRTGLDECQPAKVAGKIVDEMRDFVRGEMMSVITVDQLFGVVDNLDC